MLRIRFIKWLCLAFILGILFSCLGKPLQHESSSPGFSFAFLTDIHLEPERHAIQGFQMAIDEVNKRNPDFVLTGGDLVFDALSVSESRADSLFNLYIESIRSFKPQFYNTIGNHDLFGVYRESGITPDNKFYGTKMYEAKLGKKYYSFEHKGWKFFVLRSAQITRERQYTGAIDSVQLVWLREELASTDKSMPLAIVTHIPFITSISQIKDGSMAANQDGLVVRNSKQVLDLFKEYNLKLVLQGHLHLVEDIYVRGIHFITGGAVCGKWWQGPLDGMNEGFMLLTLSSDKISWNYVEYGWKAVK
jgi:3',5'-cyclic-AMP phosphodiesterase